MRKTKSSGSGVKSLTRVGSGVRDNVPVKTRRVKGSPEAKEHMEKIRAMW